MNMLFIVVAVMWVVTGNVICYYQLKNDKMYQQLPEGLQIIIFSNHMLLSAYVGPLKILSKPNFRRVNPDKKEMNKK